MRLEGHRARPGRTGTVMSEFGAAQEEATGGSKQG